MLKKISFTMMVLYPLVAFVSLWFSQQNLVIGYLILTVTFFGLSKFQNQQWLSGMALVSIVILISIAIISGQSQYLVYLPPMLILFSLFVVFAQTLGKSQTPLITQYAKIMGHNTDKPHQHYQRTLTKLWAVFFLLMCMTSLMLALFSSLQAWSFFTNVVSYFLVACFFIVEFIYRKHRFSDDNHGSFLTFIHKLTKARVSSMVKEDTQ